VGPALGAILSYLYNKKISYLPKKGGDNMKGHCNFWKCAHAIGIFLAILFAICFAWYFVNPVDQELHMRMLRMSYIGFSDMNLVSFVLGLVQTYVWAYVGVGIWHLVGCCQKSGTCKK
jgi:hypothetical protein